MDDRIALTASFIVVTLTGQILMVFDRWRNQWELPGGTLDPGETARQAAVRELAEKTGNSPLAGSMGQFIGPYCGSDRSWSPMTKCRISNGGDPYSPRSEGMSPLDAEIEKRILEGCSSQ